MSGSLVYVMTLTPFVVSQYMLHHIGQVAYRDGRLCWSALDRIICADWNPDGLANVRTVLAPGKTAGICTGIAS